MAEIIIYRSEYQYWCQIKRALLPAGMKEPLCSKVLVKKREIVSIDNFRARLFFIITLWLYEMFYRIDAREGLPTN